MRDHLKLGDDFLDCMGPIKIQRVPFGPAAKIINEVVVYYQSIEARDAVKSAARNLAGKPADYGVRLEFPNRLKTAMKSLQSISYEIKQKFPASRRNVLLDDEELDLVLDFCTGEGNSWRRMTSKQARERRKKRRPGARRRPDLNSGKKRLTICLMRDWARKMILEYRPGWTKRPICLTRRFDYLSIGRF